MRSQAAQRIAAKAGEARLRRLLARLTPEDIDALFDWRRLELEAAMLLVANCSEVIPPVLSLGPDIRFDDGVLDVVALKARGVMQVATTVWSLIRRAEDNDQIRRYRAREVVVESPSPQAVQLDGDADGCTPFRASVMPGALSVIVN